MKVSEEQLALWELEFLKSQSKKALRKYIDKYKDVPENTFREQAIIKLNELDKSKVSDSNNSIFSSLDFKDVLKGVGSLGFVICVIICFSSGKDWLKQQMPKPKIHDVTIPKVTIQSIGTTVEEDNSTTTQADSRSDDNSYQEISLYQENSTYTYDNSSVTEDNSRWIEYYTNQYSEMERQAERDYKSLTNLGLRYMNNGNLEGTTGRDDPYKASQISLFKQLQNRMRDLRFEASKQGVSISQSYWETVDIH